MVPRKLIVVPAYNKAARLDLAAFAGAIAAEPSLEFIFVNEAGALIRNAVAEPFRSRWIFDVELIERLLSEGATIVEFPLQAWSAVDSSRLGARAYLLAVSDCLRLIRRRKPGPG